MNGFVFFHNPDEENGYLSNWYLSDFVENGIKYSSMEQYMMYQKALLFGNIRTARRIISITDVAKIKALGRKVSRFSDDIWDLYKCDIIYHGLLSKFLCNNELKQKLVGTGTDIIAECAVNDKIWGIGLSMSDKNRYDISKWKGQNLLGQCLMRVRETLKVCF